MIVGYALQIVHLYWVKFNKTIFKFKFCNLYDGTARYDGWDDNRYCMWLGETNKVNKRIFAHKLEIWAFFLSESKTRVHQLGIGLPFKGSYSNWFTRNAHRNGKKFYFIFEFDNKPSKLTYSEICQTTQPKKQKKSRTQKKIECAKSEIWVFTATSRWKTCNK